MTITTQTTQSPLSHKLIGDISGIFFIPDYQRGYRWDTDDVKRLLDDIWKSEGKDYNLQPVVVKLRKEYLEQQNNEWELIDGQQRLTTLYLIFLCMASKGLQNTEPPYKLHYETRIGSQVYLNTLDPTIHQTNIDYFHFYKAYEFIGQWFDKHGTRRQHVANKFYGYLFDSVRIIWYEAPDDMDATGLFTRLNVGRIPLTDAELVKALLLSNIHKNQIDYAQDNRAQEVAAQWDSIERDLHSANVWGFVAGSDGNNNADQFPTRISLLLDTLAPLPNHPSNKKRPRYHTFETLREQVETSPLAFWGRVLDLHSMIMGWFDNRSLYHKIGFLTAIGTSFDKLIKLAKDKKKSEFEKMLNEHIRNTLNISAPELLELSYEKKNNDYPKLRQLLLLMNVEAVRCTEHTTPYFPFYLHTGKTWSLEHIHAQNAESLTKVQQWKSWLEAHQNALRELSPKNKTNTIEENLIQDITVALQEIDTSINFSRTFQALAARVMAVFSPPTVGTLTSNHHVHSISNLALLSREDNSTLNNSVFEVKRQIILEIDRQGGYIPACTRNVFLKYYTGADAQQIHFWSPQDRDSYFNAIVTILKDYLKPMESKK